MDVTEELQVHLKNLSKLYIIFSFNLKMNKYKLLEYIPYLLHMIYITEMTYI